ncbi:hypothetical protein ACFQPC_14535 [Herminiimonas glaciei]|uniref:TrbL/VirB6 plasmid conjugal transfer protein n=1 Tax=Herminiimonas glaciei TaxID=523788 RepID=A0ABW2IE10_9BURK
MYSFSPILRICASVNNAVSLATDVDLLDLVATSLAFKTTGFSILSATLETTLELLPVVDRDASLFGFAVTVVALLALAVTFVAGLALAAGLAAGLANGFALFTVLDFTAGAFVLTAAFGDFTALLAGAFFTALAAGLATGLAALLAGLTALPATVFAGDFLAGALLAGFARVVATAFFGAIFFALFADFVTVAFIVPCPQ